MLYPTHQDYDLAIANFCRFVISPRFRGGKPIRRKDGGLVAYSGGFSKVYPIAIGSGRVALRCWLKGLGDARYRYELVASYLRNNPMPYFVEVDFIDEGIIVDGKKYPVIYMEWAKGLRLNEFIDQNIGNPAVLRELASAFLNMVRALHSKGISHGDLQDGNILVNAVGWSINLALIDYDTLYVPTLQGLSEYPIGVSTFQHPRRSACKAAREKADYFSELVIYLSLLAYSEGRDLWEPKQEQKLLFNSEDYANPTQSRIFTHLARMSPQTKQLALKLEEFCRQRDVLELLPLEQVVGNTMTSQSSGFSTTVQVKPTNSPLPSRQRQPPHGDVYGARSVPQVTPASFTSPANSWLQFTDNLLAAKDSAKWDKFLPLAPTHARPVAAAAPPPNLSVDTRPVTTRPASTCSRDVNAVTIVGLMVFAVVLMTIISVLFLFMNPPR